MPLLGFLEPPRIVPQDFIMAPTMVPATIASIQLPKNQPHASVKGIGMKLKEPKPIEMPVARPKSAPNLMPDTNHFSATRSL